MSAITPGTQKAIDQWLADGGYRNGPPPKASEAIDKWLADGGYRNGPPPE
jgi:hypothetical protein